MKFEPIKYENGIVKVIDQTRLPVEFKILECKTVEEIWDAIKRLVVRGAPLIGISAAYGICLGLKGRNFQTKDALFKRIDGLVDYLASSRPTAVNLFWALERMKNLAIQNKEKTITEIIQALESEANHIFHEDVDLCKKIGQHGNGVIEDGDTVLTHCNAGGLATSGYGTALSVMFAAKDAGKNIHVYSGETRPLLQGSRLTAWELKKYDIPVTLICDNMAASLMQSGKINKIIVGADRIAGNGDFANKIGTYSLAVLAEHHAIDFYVAAPYSTFDFSISDGSQIAIEERAPEEIKEGFGKKTAPDDVAVFNPAFDVTPARLISGGIITEKGIFKAPFDDKLKDYQNENNR